MFQFPRFAFVSYVFRHKYLLLISANPRLAPQRPCGPSSPRLEITEIEGGFPHSEIRGSKLVRSSPRLNAAYHVLHRLSAPRHPPNTLKALDRSHYRRPLRKIRIELRSERPFASNISKSLAVKRDPRWSLASFKDRSPLRGDWICFLFTMTDSARILRSTGASRDERAGSAKLSGRVGRR